MRKILVILLFVSSACWGQVPFFIGTPCAGCDTTATEVTIGTQTWMRKNLDVVRYNDNTGIPKVTDATEWTALTTPAYCWYDNDSATYSATYGALYNWYAVNTGKLCPTGYHVPDTTEWRVLINYLGGTSVAGGKLKEIGTTHWQTPNSGATDEYCFTSLPGGLRWTGGLPAVYQNKSTQTYMRTATSYSGDWTFYMVRLDYNTDYISMEHSSLLPLIGASVRCIKD